METVTQNNEQRIEPPERIGILAGWGSYPAVVAKSLTQQGCKVFCLGVIGHAKDELSDVCEDFQWVGLAKFGRAIRYFKRHGVTDVMMLGKIHKRVLFQPWSLAKHLPDLKSVGIFWPHFVSRSEDCKDDTLLLAVVKAFAEEGIRFGSPTDYVPELLVEEGLITDAEPSNWQWKDIEFGWNVAKEMGRLDIGQSVVVKDQAVMAVEAIEGTDQCILRAGTLCPSGGFSVVKVAKPQQDMRFDVPTIGMSTLKTMRISGGRVLAIEAKRTIILEEPEVIEFANQNKIIIVALNEATSRMKTYAAA